MSRSRPPHTGAPGNGAARFARRLRSAPLQALGGLAVEYAGYVAAIVFVVLLLATRWPLRLVDDLFGTRIRERLIDLIARVSPG